MPWLSFRWRLTLNLLCSPSYLQTPPSACQGLGLQTRATMSGSLSFLASVSTGDWIKHILQPSYDPVRQKIYPRKQSAELCGGSGEPQSIILLRGALQFTQWPRQSWNMDQTWIRVSYCRSFERNSKGAFCYGPRPQGTKQAELYINWVEGWCGALEALRRQWWAAQDYVNKSCIQKPKEGNKADCRAMKFISRKRPQLWCLA